MRKKKHLLISLGYAMGLNLLSLPLGISAYPAFAGARRLPSDGFVPLTDSQLTVEQINAYKRVNPFSWNVWSTPRLEGDSICRQHQGGIVCLSPGSSKQLNWQVQSFDSDANLLDSPHEN
jgi:hypothetical protein